MDPIKLNKKDLDLAYQLANVYYYMDKNCNDVDPFDKDRLYQAITKNPNIHYKALEINNSKNKKRKNKSR